MPPPRTRLLTAVGFVAVLVTLGTTDAFLTRGTMKLPSPLTADLMGEGDAAPKGVMKNEGLPVDAILQSQQLEGVGTSQKSLLERVVRNPSEVTTQILLKDNDRIALFSRVETPSAKTYFSALKDALHSSFSSAVTDLRDETELSSTRPARNILTFKDPAIAEERIILLRVRQRLFEFHVAEGKEADVQALVEALSQ